MRIPEVLLLFAIHMTLAQDGFPQASQQAGNCSVNISGNANQVASLVCVGIDPRIAEQLRAIVNDSKHNDKSLQDISRKLDEVLHEIGNLPAKVPPRRILPEQRAQIVELLRRWPGTASISAIIGSAEAYRFAQDWYGAFQEAGWTLKDKIIGSFVQGGGPPSTGVGLVIRGEPVGPAAPFSGSYDSPAGAIIRSLEALNMKSQISGQRNLQIAEGEVDVQIYSQPEPTN